MGRRRAKELSGVELDGRTGLIFAVLAAAGVGVYLLTRKTGEGGKTEPVFTTQDIAFDSGSPAATGYGDYVGTGYMGAGSGTESQYTARANRDADLAEEKAADPTLVAPTPAATTMVAAPVTPVYPGTINYTDPKLLVKPLVPASKVAAAVKARLRDSLAVAKAKRMDMAQKKSRSDAVQTSSRRVYRSGKSRSSSGGMMTVTGFVNS